MTKWKLIIILLFFKAQLFAQGETYIKGVIDTLCQPIFFGRPPGTIYENRVVDYLKFEIVRCEQKPRIETFLYFDKDSNKELKSKNIYCFINNKAKQTIVLSAHYDHLGKSHLKSKDIRIKSFHPGANDNASGVALLLEILKSKKLDSLPKYNFLIVFYGCHEAGLYGSKYFDSNTLKKFKIALNINFDMVGQLLNKKLYVTSNVAINFPAESFSIENTKIGTLYDLDTRWTFIKNYPTVNISTGIFDDYHTQNDIAEKINYQGIVELSNMIQKWLESVNESKSY